MLKPAKIENAVTIVGNVDKSSSKNRVADRLLRYAKNIIVAEIAKETPTS